MSSDTSALNRSLLDTGSKKKLTEKQENFLSAFTQPRSETYGDVDASLEVAEYSPTAKTWILKSLRNEIVDAARGVLAGATMKSAKKIVDGLELAEDANIKKAQFERETAQDILDRVGVTKKQEIEQTITHKAVLLLPSKDKPMIPIDPEVEDIEYTEVN